MNTFTVKFWLADSEYMTALRLAVGAVCAAADADIDATEDLKVCVTESCLLLKNCGYDCAEVELGCRGGATACVRGLGGKPEERDNGFSLALISALVSSCDIVKDNGIISCLTLRI